MKKILLTLIATLLFSTALLAQTPVQVKGILDKDFVRPVKLFKVVDGRMEEIASAIPQLDKKFGFTFYPEYEGFYAIGTGSEGSQTNNSIFYFKSGDQLEFTINDNGYDLSGKSNTKENQILNKWYKESYSVYNKSYNWQEVMSTFVDFFPELETLNKSAADFAKRNKSGNAKFDNRLATFIKWEMASYASNFLNTPRTAHPAVEEYSDYYSTLSLKDFSKDAHTVYNLPWGYRTLSGISSVLYRIEKTPPADGLTNLEKNVNLYSNDTLKGDIVLDYLGRQKDFTRYKEASDRFKEYILTDLQKKRNSTIMNTMAQLKPGDQGLNFAYPNTEGKVVQLSDLKGKVVLVDVWATWCGPCKVEIPHLKKLEEEMHGKDVQVVSISVDEAKDKEKWLKMIKDENLTGLHLFASGWSEITQYYKITGIPRFMVFDKEGKIVSIDSPRPSNPELKQLLEKELAK